MKLNLFKINKLILNLKNYAGRNNTGKITIRSRGKINKTLHRIIDHKRFLFLEAIILKQERALDRNATIALILYKNGVMSYILAAAGLHDGSKINNYENKNLCSIVLLKNMNVGNILYNLETTPGAGAQYCRAAGAYFQILNIYANKHIKYILVRLKSKQKYLINFNCSAVIGISSYLYYNFYKPFTKAGQRRKIGRRPLVRGVAMNPIDHPHGGNTSGGRCSISIYGVLSKGYKTKTRKKFSYVTKLVNNF